MSCIHIPGPGGGSNGPSPLGLEDYQVERDTSLFSTTSATYVTTGKSWTTPVLAAGSYHVGLHYKIGCTIIGEGQWRLRLDGTTDVWVRENNQDFRTGNARFPAWRSQIMNLGAGAHTFDLQSKQTGGETAFTDEAYFEIWKATPSVSGTSVEPCGGTRVTSTQAASISAAPTYWLAWNTPSLDAGDYRVALSFIYRYVSGSTTPSFNMRLQGTGDQWSSDFQDTGAIITSEFRARQLLTKVNLPAGMSTFDLKLLASSAAVYDLGPYTWTIQKVP